MKNIIIEPAIKSKCPNLQLGCLQAKVKVEPSNATLLDKINNEITTLQTSLEVAQISQIPIIQSSRQAYRTLGKEPARYRLSAEALLRRIVKGKGLYRINNVVDLLNLISVKSGYSIGGYDADKIEGDICLGIGQANEPYQAIGRGNLNIEFMPLLRDDIGAFGSPTSDSQRTMVTENTQNFLMVFFNFGGHDGLEKILEEAKKLIETYTLGSSIVFRMIV